MILFREAQDTKIAGAMMNHAALIPESIIFFVYFPTTLVPNLSL